MNSSIENGSLPKPPFHQKKVCLHIAHYYGVMRQRLIEAYGDRAYFSLTDIPSYVTIQAVEYAVSFTSALSARLLLSLGQANRMIATLTEGIHDIYLSFTAVPQTRELIERSLDAYRELFAGIAERGGFSCAIEDGETVKVTITLHRITSVPNELQEEFPERESDPFADALAYPL